MKAYFPWKCPHCEYHHVMEEVDSEWGPFNSLVCSGCGKRSDFSNLSNEDFTAWDDAIESVT